MTTRDSRPTDPPAGAGAADDPDSRSGHRRSHREKHLERKRLDALTERLVRLRPHELDLLRLEDDLREAVDELKALTGSARGRQARYVHGLLRDMELDELERRVRMGSGSSYAPVPESSRSPVDRWLDRLIAEGDPAVNELVESHAKADRQQLRQLIRTSSKRPATTASRRALRSLRATLEELLG
jgi:ribosome-associated protein